MDDLDKQLAELQLINNAELPPNPGAALHGKKVGPAVPPKPKKQQQPLVSLMNLTLGAGMRCDKIAVGHVFFCFVDESALASTLEKAVVSAQ